MADKVPKPKKSKAKTKQDEKGVLAALPSTRPERIGTRRTGTTVSAAVGGAVAVAGVVGFIGLVVPHLLRNAVGHHPSRLLWPSFLGGCGLKKYLVPPKGTSCLNEPMTPSRL